MKPDDRAEVRRHFSAPPERVFAAFTRAEVVARWLTPSPDVNLTVLELDFREGGRYRFAYESPGGERMLVGGVYTKIDAPTRLEFSWLIEPPDVHAGIESRVIVSITARGSGSDLLIVHERFGRADANQRHAAGWAGALQQLHHHLTSQAEST